MQTNSGDSVKGGLAAIVAFLIWGIIPVYWKLLQSVNAYELVMHRVFWSAIFLILLVRSRGKFSVFLEAFQNKSMVRIHTLGGVLLGMNWLAFIYAVTHDQILQASLAYFIVPLTNAGMGYLFLQERLSKIKGVAILCATLGVLNEVLRVDDFPWLAMVMASTFGIYSLLKKKTSLGTITGLTMENTAIFPIATVGLLVLLVRGDGVMFRSSWDLQVLLILAGVVTTIPLMLFSYGAARIQLNTLGFIEFIGPMTKFGLAVWLYHEPFSSAKMVTFGGIWAGIILYLWDSYHGSRIKDVPPDL